MIKDRGLIAGLPDIAVDEVDRRLEDGWTLPASLYTDPVVARLENELIWKPSWQVVGTLADFRNPGDFLTAQLGTFPVLVTRGKDGALRGFLNVCRHRGALVAGGETGGQSDNVSGNCSRFQCRYHGWTYGLDGRLIGAPDWKDAGLPPFEELGLHPVSVDTWAGAVFVSVDPAEPLHDFLSDATQIAEENQYKHPFESDDIEFGGSWEHHVKANWKVFMENNLECYHCSTTHADNLAAVFKVDRGNFCSVNYKNGNHIAAPFTDDLANHIDKAAADKLREEVEITKEMPFQQYWFWPANMISAGVGIGDFIFRIDPIDANNCRMVTRLYVGQDEPAEKARLDEFISEVLPEDVAVSSGVQLGLRSGGREWGPLLSTREASVKWFESQVWSHLTGAFQSAAD